MKNGVSVFPLFETTNLLCDRVLKKSTGLSLPIGAPVTSKTASRFLTRDTVVVGEIPGKVAIACRFATHFFKLLKAKGVPTHYIDTISDNEMIVEPAIPFGMKVEGPAFINVFL